MNMEELVAADVEKEIIKKIYENSSVTFFEKSFDDVYNDFFKNLDNDKFSYEILSKETKEEIKNFFYKRFYSTKNYYEIYTKYKGLGFLSRIFDKIDSPYKIILFFDENGPTKEFYDIAISQGKCDVLKSLNELFKIKYSNNKVILNYLKFRGNMEYAMSSENIFFKQIKIC